jgi:hypothetical protein
VESGCSVTYRIRIQAKSLKMNDVYIKCDAKIQNPKEGLKKTVKGKQPRRRLM